MEYTKVKNLIWLNEEKTAFNCEVNFADLGEEFVPFTAAENDLEEHGQEIFMRGVTGEFGPIAKPL